MVGENDATSKNAIYLRFRAKGKHYHAQIPVLKRLPFPSIAIISLLVIINILVWIAVGIVLVSLDERILHVICPNREQSYHT